MVEGNGSIRGHSELSPLLFWAILSILPVRHYFRLREYLIINVKSLKTELRMGLIKPQAKVYKYIQN